MWYVISTPDPNDPEDEQIWECPSNWIVNRVLHYPEEGKKSRKSLLDKIKQKEEPQASWIKTSIFKFIKTKEGVSVFDTFKNAARVKAEEVLRKDTSDESESNIAQFSIKTREQRLNMKRKLPETDLNELAVKCQKTSFEKIQTKLVEHDTSETLEEIKSFVRNELTSENNMIENHRESQDDFYKQFINTGEN
ncbi:hypothetical protein ACFFRR_003325 [Megaselia abdita]